jgi:hypothetical protein
VGKYGSFSRKTERERHVVNMVVEAVRNCEHETLPARNRWKEANELFNGIMDWGDENVSDEWQSRIFLHEFSVIIREAAQAVMAQVGQSSEFIKSLGGDEVNREFADILRKLINNDLKELKFFGTLYEHLLTGAIFGLGIYKLNVAYKTCFRPELVVEKIAKGEQERIRRASGIEEKTQFQFPESMDEITKELNMAMQDIVGVQQGAYARPTVKPKKYLDIGFALTSINPFNFFFHPDCNDPNDSPWKADRMWTTFGEIAENFNSGVWDKDKREDMKKATAASPYGSSGTATNYEYLKSRQRNQFTQQSSYFPRCEIIEYFGPLYDKDGDILEENCHFVVGNGRHLLYDYTNEYWDQQSPYVTTKFSPKPFDPVGAGIADNATEMQKLINELFSVFVDMVRFDTYSPTVANMDRLMDPSQVENGIRPGEVLKGYGEGRAEDIFSTLPSKTSVAPTLFQTIEMLKLAGQKGASINTATSNPASRARITSAEIVSNDQRRNTSVTNLSMFIDQNCIEPLVQKLKALNLQFSFSGPGLDSMKAKSVLEPAEFQMISEMSQVERFKHAVKNYKLEIKGFRSAVDRAEVQSRVAEWMQQINQMPDAAQAKLDWPEIISDVTELYGLSGEKWIKQRDELDIAHEENELLKDNKFISLGEDKDEIHLPVHYEALMKFGPIPALANHAMAHIQRLMQSGGQVPTPPPEVAGMLGLPDPEAPQDQQQASKRLESNEQRAPMPIGALVQ